MEGKGRKHFSAEEVLEAIFQDQDSHNEQFDCGSDIESENDSDLDSWIEQIVTNLELEDEEQKSFQQEAIVSPGIFVAKIKSIISL